MFFLSFFRVIKFSLQDVTRNIWLSLVTIIILILALFSMNMILVVKIIGDTTVVAIKDKIDISIYLKPETEEKQILDLKAQISSLSEVKDVKYISKTEALEIFKEEFKNKPEILQALREIGKNPLTPTLIIKPTNNDSLDGLINQLNKIENSFIDSRDFTDHKAILAKINSVTDKVKKAGMALAAIFILTTLLVVYNSIRVAIYTHSKEIGIMRLVGASNSFIYMPFIISSLIYTFFGVAAIIAIFYPFLSLLQPYMEAFFVGYNINIIEYFNHNFIKIFGGQFLGIAFINTIASFIAVRKYSQV